MLLAKSNGRVFPKEDKIFALSGRAKAMEKEVGKDNVINATIGSLMDDDGNLVVLSSVMKAISELSPDDFAAYAPIGGTPGFKAAVTKAAFGNYSPKRFTEACAAPGGTGTIRNTVSNYSNEGDTVITASWFWPTYTKICNEIGRKLDTYEMFREDGSYNIAGLEEKVKSLVDSQGSCLAIINTPAHNPTGYCVSNEEWREIVRIFNEAVSGGGTGTIFVDAAYIDFAGDPEEYRQFLKEFEALDENVLVVIGYSASKTFTLYGMRTGAAICMAATKEQADEFRTVMEYSSRASWSNCVRAGQTVIEKIYADNVLLDKVTSERAKYRSMLIKRGHVFEEAARSAGLECVPFDSGFFTCIECDDPDGISAKLEEKGDFVVPFAKGIRISIAAISEEKCVKIAKDIAEVLK
ncbi:MAG: pyridoxal phosphate-dependent aminotransferase [Anaerovoracaceae bacterium]|jgi:aromatic-amino-acid transaminase